MAKNADVLIDPYRPGVLEKLGLGPHEVLLKDNPRLIVVRVTGWGQSGPMSQAAGHDINYIALTGALSLFSRSPRDAPVAPINILGDFAGGGALAAFGVLLALHERTKSGLGQVIDAAMVDGVAHLSTFLYRMRQAGGWNDVPGTNVLDSGAPFYDTYTCSDGKFLSVGAIEPQFYELLLAGLGLAHPDELPGSQMDRKLWADNKRVIAGRIAMKPRDHWAGVFAPEGKLRDACVAPVLTMQEAATHPYNVARNVFSQGHTKQPKDVLPNPAPRLSRTPGHNLAYWRVEPSGANSRTVLMMYGFSAKEVDALAARGVVRVDDSKL
jgi:alpha-methylacyl-CoA racemase